MAPVDLDSPLSWQTALAAHKVAERSRAPQDDDNWKLLENLQANILTSHVRTYMRVLLLQVKERAAAREGLAWLVTSGLLKCAADQLIEARAYADSDGRVTGTPYVGVGISASGFAALDLLDRLPTDDAFRAGMRGRRALLEDPADTEWEPVYQRDIHVIVLTGAATDDAVSDVRNEIVNRLGESFLLIGEEFGRGLLDTEGREVQEEHFGYQDGISQPIFITDDLPASAVTGTDWSPVFPLRDVLVDGIGDVDEYGSYLVFRKLEQNVRLFKQAEQGLACELALEEDGERAGAMIVGRFEKGTPLVLSGTDDRPGREDLTFTYSDDGDGGRCPFQAHIRRMNPRTDEARRHVITRRGQTYGDRPPVEAGEHAEGKDDDDLNGLPTGGVGLLFMAFGADVENRFEYLQHLANTAQEHQGLDPVIGQGDPVPAAWPKTYRASEPTKVKEPIAQAVTLKGGEYFFAPSLGFLRSL